MESDAKEAPAAEQSAETETPASASLEVPTATLVLPLGEACVLLNLAKFGARHLDAVATLHIVAKHTKDYESLRAKLVELADWHEAAELEALAAQTPEQRAAQEAEQKQAVIDLLIGAKKNG